MKNSSLMSVGAATALLLAGVVAEAAEVPFSDPFDNLANWTVADGTVDLVNNGDFGLQCSGGAGSCVDMDGTAPPGGTPQAGTLVSTPFSLLPGKYQLSFDVSGNQRGAPSDTMNVTVGDPSTTLTTLTVIRESGVAFPGSVILPFDVNSPIDATITFAHLGGDNIGMLLDNVSLTQIAAVPVPAAAVLFLSALGCLSAFRRRRGVVENA